MKIVNLPRSDGRLGPEMDMATAHNKALAWSKFLAWLTPADPATCGYCFERLRWDGGYVHHAGSVFCDPGGMLNTVASPRN